MQSDPANRFLVEAFAPVYLDPGIKASMKDRVEAALAELRSCSACPRNCGVDRLSNETKRAIGRTGRHARV